MFFVNLKGNVLGMLQIYTYNFILILILQSRWNDSTVQLEFEPQYVELQSLYPTMMPFKKLYNFACFRVMLMNTNYYYSSNN